jgi:uncharacterized protein GlcG (DUF336 family)
MKRPLERLETRDVPSASAALFANVLRVDGTAGADRIDLRQDQQQIVVLSAGREIGRFAAAGINRIDVFTYEGNDVVKTARDLLVPVNIDGGLGNDKLVGGPAEHTLTGGQGKDLLQAGSGTSTLNPGTGNDKLRAVKPVDAVTPNPHAVTQLKGSFAVKAAAAVAGTQIITIDDVQCLLARAAAATASDDAIIAVVDRNGRILGVRVEAGVAASITSDPNLLTFAIDGAIAKARTAAFFANNQAPLTSRTVQFISQSTITQREVEAVPFDTDINSIGRGPGYVAPVGSGGHFPPNVPLTPMVDLFGIEHTNRDSLIHPGPDHIRGTADDINLLERFNIDPAWMPPGVELYAPESYGFAFGQVQAQNRGIATLPGGIPLYKNGELVGGIGVFFPGRTGFATEENSALSTIYDPTKPDRSLEAEYIAFVAAGGAPGIGFGFGVVNGVPNCGFALPLTQANQRIDLVGVTLDIIGPGGINGPGALVRYGQTLGVGDPNSGMNVNVAPGQQYQEGLPVADGWLVNPHDGVGITAAQVLQIIQQGIDQANQTRAAIRLPLSSSARMVFAVTDLTGEVLGLYRMPDATVFSIDVAVAKARNVAYYNNAAQLQAIDQVAGVPPGTALTARSFRYLADPRFPEGIDGRPPGPFSIYNDGGSNPITGQQVGPRLPASAFQSAYGYDSFNPGTNFHDPNNIANQNGVVFFPGSAGLYANDVLIGGLGVSGDGVDQDDVVTALATTGFKVPNTILRADQTFVRGVRLPYQKFNRNPQL